MTSSYLVAQCVLIYSIELRKTRDMSSPRVVVSVVTSVFYDDAVFAKVPVAREGGIMLFPGLWFIQ